MISDRSRPILVVDDDAKILRLVRMYLERAGHSVLEASDGEDALRLVAEGDPALVILDLMLPMIDGLSVLETIRRASDTPVIILSARGTTVDRIEGLRTGADDYLPKPFSPAELVLRVARILERGRGPQGIAGPSESAPLSRNGLLVDGARHLVEVDGRPVELSVIELRLLTTLLEADGRVLTRDRLLDAVYGSDAVAVVDRTIDVLVKRLREKLGDPAAAPRFIATVRGAGYRAARSA